MNQSAVDATAAACGGSRSGVKEEAEPAGHLHPSPPRGSLRGCATAEAPAVITAKTAPTRTNAGLSHQYVQPDRDAVSGVLRPHPGRLASVLTNTRLIGHNT